MAVEKTNIGWMIPVKAVESFKEYCDDVNDNYGDALAAAITIWQYLPATVQRLAQLEAFGKPSVDKKFWREFSKGLDQAVLSQVRGLKSED